MNANNQQQSLNFTQGTMMTPRHPIIGQQRLNPQSQSNIVPGSQNIHNN